MHRIIKLEVYMALEVDNNNRNNNKCLDKIDSTMLTDMEI